MGRNSWISVLLKEDRIKVVSKESRIPKIVNVSVPLDLIDLKKQSPIDVLLKNLF